jgi:hypothetical protein
LHSEVVTTQEKMAKIFALAESGMGKTSSLRNLPPEKTGIINSDKKELPIQGWKAKYKTIPSTDKLPDGSFMPDLFKSNYIETSKFDSVMKVLAMWDARPDLEYIALDTATHLILHDYINNTIGKDYKAYQGMGKNFYMLADFVRQMKKNVVVFAHLDKTFNEVGDKKMGIKAPGKMIGDMVPESFFTTVLIGEVQRKDGKASHWYRTQSMGDDPAKSPAYFIGEEVKTALELYEPNDIKLIFDKLKKYEEEII